MMDRPYIKDVIKELQVMGYDEHDAKKVLTKYYRPLKRRVGFDPNARDFARELNWIAKGAERKYNPDDPNQIYIGDLKELLNKTRTRRRNNTVHVLEPQAAQRVKQSKAGSYMGSHTGMTSYVPARHTNSNASGKIQKG